MVREFASRRRAVLERLGPGVAVFASAPICIRNHDVEHPYRQDSDFYYLTGLDEPESVAILTNRHPEHRFVLFVRPRHREREIWDGPRVGIEGAIERYGADAAYPISELAERLPQYLTNAPRLLYALGRDRAMDDRVIAALQAARRRERHAVLAPTEIVDPIAVLHPLRKKKSPAELEAMERAIAATHEAHLRAMRAAKPGVFEYEVEAELLRTLRRWGCERPAYAPIVGSGPNATILHYRRNDRRIEDGDLLLVDAGGEWGYQAADVTRTFPVNGRFTTAQRAIYDVVLRAQKLAIAAVRPGVTLDDVHQVTVRSITEGLIELGLIEGATVEEAIANELYKPFFMHRTSHWLGMDVHDVGPYYTYEGEGPKTRPVPMEPGNVITVEPGLYVAPDANAPREWLGIGVRIEDDVLVTESGHRNLTAHIPKDPDELETLLAQR
jgi:Xaa-Pro aminopeptidase